MAAAAPRIHHPMRPMLLAVLGVSIVGVVIAAVAAVLSWNRSLGPELVTLEASEGALPGDALPAPAGEPACGGPPVMMMLLVGSDAQSSDYAAGFADVIRIARIDFVSRSITLLAVPRDLWVPIPGLEAYGIAGNRIKTAYTYGNRYAVPGGGQSLLSQTLTLNFGLRADQYMIISFAAFEAGIDALGGIDVYLPEPVESQAPGEQGFPAGWQHMDGATALSYARFRPDNSSDLARIERQTQVIAAVRAKMFDAQNGANLTDLVAALQTSILTDLSPSEISSLVCLGRQVEAGDIQTVTIEGDRVIPAVDKYGHERLLPNSEAIRQLVRDFNSGRLASSP
jgi:LCP family protein required for cell wall assembly